MNINDCQVQEILFIEAPRSIWYIIITWWINEGIHITCDCLILLDVWLEMWWSAFSWLGWLRMRSFLTINSNNNKSVNQLIVKNLPFVALRNPANLDNTSTYSPHMNTHTWYRVIGTRQQNQIFWVRSGWGSRTMRHRYPTRGDK